MVKLGLEHNDYDNIRQYLVLLENLLQAVTCDWHEEFMELFLTEFVQESIGNNLAYYMWMETVLEWIFKITGKSEVVRKWFFEN